MARTDGRKPEELRPMRIRRGCNMYAEGSAEIEMGRTKVICTASFEYKLPQFLRGSGRGWVTGEYGMLPRSTKERMNREASMGRQGGRTLEIQRLIGRSLRAVTDMNALGEYTIWVDCDVIQADGGTRTAAINGAYVALYDAFRKLVEDRKLPEVPLSDFVAAISVGIVDGKPMLDLDFEEDVNAEVDMNIVMTGSGNLVELQGTAEKRCFDRQELDEILDLARNGIEHIVALQRKSLMSGCEVDVVSEGS
jgi:ribonuclease PH